MIKELINMSDEDFRKFIEKPMFPNLSYRSLEKNYESSMNVNPEICTKCKGECCRRCGCYFSPDDFETISFELLKKEIEKGYISIDYVRDFEAISEDFFDIDILILRIRNRGAPIVDTSIKGGQCILLTENGCKLDYEHRPAGGKLLIPAEAFIDSIGRKQRNCSSTYTMEDCCYEWKPHQQILMRLKDYFQDKEIECSI